MAPHECKTCSECEICHKCGNGREDELLISSGIVKEKARLLRGEDMEELSGK